MFVGYTDTGVKAWDTVSTSSIPIFTLSEHTGNVTSLGLNQTGNALCTGSADRTIKVFIYLFIPSFLLLIFLISPPCMYSLLFLFSLFSILRFGVNLFGNELSNEIK